MLLAMFQMKCLKYWPDIDHTMKFGPHTITLKTEDVYDLYTLRTMSVKYEVFQFFISRKKKQRKEKYFI